MKKLRCEIGSSFGDSEEIAEAIMTSVIMRANFIETGSPFLSRNDAIRARRANLVKELDGNQEKLVSMLKDIHRQMLDKIVAT